jgi:sugar/nucleoside kinase (ribokinase family)
VRFDAKPSSNGPGTGRCLVLVTPDAQRTMHTYLGIAGDLAVEDIDEALFASGAATFLEGYLWDPPGARAALREAAAATRSAGRIMAFTLSDGFLVDRHRVEFLEFIADEVDLLFANRVELTSLFNDDDVASAAMAARELCDIVAVTLGEDGSMIVSGQGVCSVAPVVIGEVVDTTGAGDLYAAGFLYGLTRGMDHAVCGHLGSLAAAEIISHMGSRPQGRLAELVADEI